MCDLLDLLGGTDTPVQPSSAPTSTATTTSSADLLDLLGGLEPTPVPAVTVYEKNGVSLKIQCDSQTDTDITVTLIASNSTQNDISNFTLQAAVPKSVQLQMKAPSGNVIAAHGLGQVTQTVLLNNPNKVSLKMRVRVSYSDQGTMLQDTVQIDSFPSPSWNSQPSIGVL